MAEHADLVEQAVQLGDAAANLLGEEAVVVHVWKGGQREGGAEWTRMQRGVERRLVCM